MAKSKKNKKAKKNKKTANVTPKPRYSKDDTALWLYINNFITSKTASEQGVAPMSVVGRLIRDEYKKNFRCSEEHIDYILSHDLKTDKEEHEEDKNTDFLRTFYADILNRHPALDKTMNIYNPESDWKTKPDIIDFRNYMFDENYDSELKNFEDVLSNSHYYSTTCKDSSILWSPSEYTILQLTDSAFYIMRRDRFDDSDNSVIYTGIMYKHLTLFSANDFIAPVCIFEVQTKIASIADIDLSSLSKPNEVVNFAIKEEYLTVLRSNECYSSYVKSFINSCNIDVNKAKQLADEELCKNFYTVCYKLKALTSPYDISGYHKKYYRNDNRYEIYNSLLNNINSEFIFDNNIFPLGNHENDELNNQIQSYLRIREYVSIPLAMLAVMNGMLRCEKLSKAVKEKPDTLPEIPSHIRYKISDNIEKSQSSLKRQTRHIKGIAVTTAQRPRALNIDQIICFTKSEWSVKGHIRTYKSGKTAYIKPTTAHRKCVDMSDVKTSDNIGKKYIVHNKRSSEKGGSK